MLKYILFYNSVDRSQTFALMKGFPVSISNQGRIISSPISLKQNLSIRIVVKVLRRSDIQYHKSRRIDTAKNLFGEQQPHYIY